MPLAPLDEAGLLKSGRPINSLDSCCVILLPSAGAEEVNTAGDPTRMLFEVVHPGRPPVLAMSTIA